MIFADPKPDEITYVCLHLREKSKEDIFGAAFDDLDEFRHAMVNTPGHKWVGYHAGLPAAIFGAHPIHKGVWGLFGFGTDAWQKIWRPVTRVAREELISTFEAVGAHRAHCVSPAHHTDTHAWLKLLGATVETPMPKYGKDGQDYVMFAWIKDN